MKKLIGIFLMLLLSGCYYAPSVQHGVIITDAETTKRKVTKEIDGTSYYTGVKVYKYRCENPRNGEAFKLLTAKQFKVGDTLWIEAK